MDTSDINICKHKKYYQMNYYQKNLYVPPSSIQSKLTKDKAYYDYQFDKSDDNNKFHYMNESNPDYIDLMDTKQLIYIDKSSDGMNQIIYDNFNFK